MGSNEPRLDSVLSEAVGRASAGKAARGGLTVGSWIHLLLINSHCCSLVGVEAKMPRLTGGERDACERDFKSKVSVLETKVENHQFELRPLMKRFGKLDEWVDAAPLGRRACPWLRSPFSLHLLSKNFIGTFRPLLVGPVCQCGFPR